MAEISLYPSLLLRGAAIVLLMTSCIPLAAMQPPVWIELAVFVVIVTLACRLLLRLAGKPPAIQRLRLEADACCMVVEAVSQRYQLPRIRYLGEWLLILDLVPAVMPNQCDRLGALRAFLRRRRLVIASDSLSKEHNWRLRYYLRNTVGSADTVGQGA